MSKAVSAELVPTIPADLAPYADRATTYHRSFRISAQASACYAFLAGRELNQIKEKIAHGHFMKFCELHLPEIPERSARRYMGLASEIGHVADLPEGSKLKVLENGRLPEGEEQKVVKAFAKATDGKRLTELYRDTGIIRDKQEPKHTPAQKLTAEEAIAARLDQVKAIFASAIDGLNLIAEMEEGDKGIVPRDQWDALKNACIPAAKLARTMLRNSRKTKSKKGSK